MVFPTGMLRCAQHDTMLLAVVLLEEHTSCEGIARRILAIITGLFGFPRQGPSLRSHEVCSSSWITKKSPLARTSVTAFLLGMLFI
jgi:hypothetical protein